ncbi:hypothetical protein [Sporomusa termitida]|uniref:Uncharacterized protein n=1 Tax=Sporomusa termitida TaxID=2377 RepID=A0A517DUT8_9FIRM|nr:hypothetical protein [Sporomusa termitida]QDR81068.1 hypothetical protein SPTER_24230 [Sporomusa termitida]
MYCEIIYQVTGERWGIFPRDKGEFQARLLNSDGINIQENQKPMIRKSEQIEIMSCSFTPDEKNKRHRRALDGLVEKLVKAGWQQLPEQGAAWYSLRFYKDDETMTP